MESVKMPKLFLYEAFEGPHKVEFIVVDGSTTEDAIEKLARQAMARVTGRYSVDGYRPIKGGSHLRS